MRVSLCMIVKDEEEVLERCLSSAARLFDEIVIVDTGSTDGTVEIALSFGAKVYQFPWRDDFSAARNYGLNKATGDYLMWLDADDVIAPREAEKFPALKARLLLESPDLVMCPYVVMKNGEVCLRFQRERIFRRESGFLFTGRVHECAVPQGKRFLADFSVTHLGSDKERGDRNLKIYRKWSKEEALDARHLYYYGRELYYNGCYDEARTVLTKMLKDEGWYVNKIGACQILSLMELKESKPQSALSHLFASFYYGEPRAAVVSEIARIYRLMNRREEAIYWYNAALCCRDHSEEGDFEAAYARNLTPLLALCRLWYEKGDMEKAKEYHKRAYALFPTHPSVVYNQRFFHD